MKRINPYKKYHGSFIPEWLLPIDEISSGAKLCFARLARFAGQDGKAYPKIETLASKLGVSKRQCSSYLKELKDVELIESDQQGLGKPNIYYFLEHEWQECRLNNSDRMKDTSSQGGTKLHDKDEEYCNTGMKNTSSPIYKESHNKESQKEDSFVKRLEKAESKQALLDIWIDYRKTKNKYPTNFEQDVILNKDWKGKALKDIKNAIYHTVSNGWVTLQWPEKDESNSSNQNTPNMQFV